MTEQSGCPFLLYRQRMSEQLGTPEAVLTGFAAGPEDLDRALACLSESDLNLVCGPDKWTIRQIVHHIVDGDYVWGMCARVAIGNPGSTYRLDWYRQDPWVDALGHAERPIAPALGLLRANAAIWFSCWSTCLTLGDSMCSFRGRSIRTDTRWL